MAIDKDFDTTININSTTNASTEFVKKRNRFSALRYKLRTYIAEFLGSLILLMFGTGVIAQVSFNPASTGSAFLSINLGWGIGIAFAVLVALPVSGAHLNPAVTLACAIFKKFPWSRVPGYMLSQLLGSFFGSALVYSLYYPALNSFDHGTRQTTGELATAGIFTTFPHPCALHINSFMAEILCTAVLMFLILAVSDTRHNVPSYMAALSIGGVVLAIGLSIGLMTGYSMNPARDLGPRIFLTMVGYGWEPFTAQSWYFWVPLTAPFIGAIIGLISYDSLIICED